MPTISHIVRPDGQYCANAQVGQHKRSVVNKYKEVAESEARLYLEQHLGIEFLGWYDLGQEIEIGVFEKV